MRAIVWNLTYKFLWNPLNNWITNQSGIQEISIWNLQFQSSRLKNSVDAVFDVHRHLLVLEYYRRHVHIINAATGGHLQTITPGMKGKGKCLILSKEGDIIASTQYPNYI